MSEIAEIRQMLQDLIAPDIKALKAEVSALKTSVDERFVAAEKLAQERFLNTLERFAAAEKLAQERFAAAEKLAQERFLNTLERFTTADKVSQERHASSEALFQARHATVLAKLEALEGALELDKRVRRIEDREASGRQVA